MVFIALSTHQTSKRNIPENAKGGVQNVLFPQGGAHRTANSSLKEAQSSRNSRPRGSPKMMFCTPEKARRNAAPSVFPQTSPQQTHEEMLRDCRKKLISELRGMVTSVGTVALRASGVIYHAPHNTTYPKGTPPELFFGIAISQLELVRIDFKELPDTLCICVSCMTLPA